MREKSELHTIVLPTNLAHLALPASLAPRWFRWTCRRPLFRTAVGILVF